MPSSAARGKRHLPEVARFVMDAERHGLALSRALREPMEPSQRGSPARRGPFSSMTSSCGRSPWFRLPIEWSITRCARCCCLTSSGSRIFHSCLPRGKGQHAALHCCQNYVRACDGWCLRGHPRLFCIDSATTGWEVIHRRVGSPIRERSRRSCMPIPAGKVADSQPVR